MSSETVRKANWTLVKDGNWVARGLAHRHYSYRKRSGRQPKLFVGPGQKMVLLSKDRRALFVWRKFIDDSGQEGVCCAIFRNEGDVLSSELILEAEQWAWGRWPGERLYTHVAPSKVRSTNPGYCFLAAGWRKCGVTRVHGHIIMEKFPGESF